VLTFDFVDRNEVRVVLEDYYAQARKAESADSYLGAVVGCGAVAEGVLTWALKRNESGARATLTRILARDSGRRNKPSPHKPIENWRLETLVEVANEMGVLDDDAKQTCEAIRNYRNLVHPYRRVNGSPRFDASLEQSAFRAIERIVQALGGIASPATFSDVEMNFSWVIEDHLAGCRGPNTREDLEYLRAKGIRALVRLEGRTRVTVEQISDVGLVDYLEPVRDFGTPTRHKLEKILNFIDKMLRQKKPVAVSCGAGYGRTGTVLACFRVRQGRTAQEALTWLQEVRPCSAKEILESCPNQRRFISDFPRHTSAR
jgi:atypical dual specificity phosphatase